MKETRWIIAVLFGLLTVISGCDKPEAFPPTGTFTDSRDNHVYKYLTAGAQIWMAENLAYLPTVSPADSFRQLRSIITFADTGAKVLQKPGLQQLIWHTVFGTTGRQPWMGIVTPVMLWLVAGEYARLGGIYPVTRSG